MTRRPVSTPVRALAAFAYLLPVAIVLLALPAYRRIRLIRVHAAASTVLNLGTASIVLLLGSLRPGSFEVGIFIGLVLSLALLAFFGGAIWGAIWAYQGRNPPWAGVNGLIAAIERRLAARREPALGGHGLVSGAMEPRGPSSALPAPGSEAPGDAPRQLPLE